MSCPNEPYRQAFAKLVDQCREKYGWSQKDLADTLGVAYDSIYDHKANARSTSKLWWLALVGMIAIRKQQGEIGNE